MLWLAFTANCRKKLSNKNLLQHRYVGDMSNCRPDLYAKWLEKTCFELTIFVEFFESGHKLRGSELCLSMILGDKRFHCSARRHSVLVSREIERLLENKNLNWRTSCARSWVQFEFQMSYNWREIYRQMPSFLILGCLDKRTCILMIWCLIRVKRLYWQRFHCTGIKQISNHIHVGDTRGRSTGSSTMNTFCSTF